MAYVGALLCHSFGVIKLIIAVGQPEMALAARDGLAAVS
jgi:hypothetical protein